MNIPEARYVSLRTFRKSGKAVDTPVWIAPADQKTHYIFSAAGAGKVKRIRNSSAAQLTTCDARGGSLGDWHDCHAYLVEDVGETDEAYRLLIEKYGWQNVVSQWNLAPISPKLFNCSCLVTELPTTILPNVTESSISFYSIPWHDPC